MDPRFQFDKSYVTMNKLLTANILTIDFCKRRSLQRDKAEHGVIL